MQKVRLQHHHITSQLEYEYILGPIKIKDGLFMGDELAAKDVEFILSNKVSHIINTVSRRIPNIWEKIGVQYLSFNWTENEQNIFDKKSSRLNELYNFIEQAMELGQSCLVHSVNAKSRAFVVVAAYMMKKYSWSLEKTIEYITLKKPQLDIRQVFYYQLKELESRLTKLTTHTSNWQEALNDEDLILRNTYINSKAIEYTVGEKKTAKTARKVTWMEADVKGYSQYKDDKRRTLLKEPTPERTKPVKYEGEIGKSILKTSKSVTKQGMLRPEEPQAEPQIINNLNNNIIHVTINNFITPDDGQIVDNNSRKGINNVNPLMTRPLSSDAKDRQKKKDIKVDSRKMIYDNFFSNSKSPYEPKFMSSKIPTKTTKPLNSSTKKQEPVVPARVAAFERPQSASNTDKKKVMVRGTASNLVTKEEMMVINGSVKKGTMGRYPSPMVAKQSDTNLVISSTQYKDKWRGL